MLLQQAPSSLSGCA
uniref:Uncharacterized protein n=1 Tax=Arundo donax TaxID=35708 RepID=A0A0A8XSA9_ARUDO